jgi:hypothetical protein
MEGTKMVLMYRSCSRHIKSLRILASIVDGINEGPLQQELTSARTSTHTPTQIFCPGSACTCTIAAQAVGLPLRKRVHEVASDRVAFWNRAECCHQHRGFTMLRRCCVIQLREGLYCNVLTQDQALFVDDDSGGSGQGMRRCENNPVHPRTKL